MPDQEVVRLAHSLACCLDGGIGRGLHRQDALAERFEPRRGGQSLAGDEIPGPTGGR